MEVAARDAGQRIYLGECRGALIFRSTHAEPETFLDDFIARNWSSPYFFSPLYATNVRRKVRAAAERGIFESMVEFSDIANLIDKFLPMPVRCMFMFGEQNDSLSYLGHLAANGVELANIPFSGYFPMYSNAPKMRRRIHDFQARAEQESAAASAPRLASN